MKHLRLLLLAITAAAVVAVAFGGFAWDLFRNGPVNGIVSSARASMREAHTALEAYRIDHGQYPATAQGWSALTTPAAYLDELPIDPFSRDRSPILYTSDGTRFLLVSRGPDEKLDLDPLEQFLGVDPKAPGARVANLTYDPTNGVRSPGDIWHAGEMVAPERVLYDPTNGTYSGNGIWRVKQ